MLSFACSSSFNYAQAKFPMLSTVVGRVMLKIASITHAASGFLKKESKMNGQL